ncbi:MAG: aminotransferase class I/II-fold pyridoxal phosphate-dependent enzyme [Bacteroidia bacterium]|nr:aminotransferase class I/II-fold pyridoxal phosphate-dependent enzyme [Bacteroidia bacterium]
MSKSKTAQSLEAIDESVSRASELGLIHLTAEDYALNGRTINIKGKDLINFGSCSYLGLEIEESLKQGAIDAILRYGTQYSSSRAYVSIGLYEEAEKLLESIYKRPVILAASVTHGHLSNLPVLIEDEDAVILDYQVHASVQMAANLLRIRGIRVELVRHNNMDMLESRIQKLSATHKRIWYLADGIYSMYGDFAPMDRLTVLLNKYDQFHLYIDDAHGSSAFGENGSGYVNSVLPYHERLYLVAGMAKSFGAAGGILVYPNEESRRKVKTCGGTMIFSGPLQPANLGAIIASLKLHMGSRLPELQQRLRNKIAYFNLRAEELQVPVFSESISPICFINVGLQSVGYKIVDRLQQNGFFVNLAVYPSVPKKNTGVRVAISNHITYKDVDALLQCVAEELPKVLKEENSSMEDVYEAFKVKT